MVYRWDPFRDLMDLSSALLGHEPRLGLLESRASAWIPPIDIYETDVAYIIKAELPGVDPNHVKLELKEHRLTLAGERPAAAEGRRYHQLERLTGPFERSFNLPGDLTEDDIEARYADGILAITLRKREVQPARVIEVAVKP